MCTCIPRPPPLIHVFLIGLSLAATSASLPQRRDGAVIFVGMDTPELPWSEVVAAKTAAEKDGKAYICPGMLCLCARASILASGDLGAVRHTLATELNGGSGPNVVPVRSAATRFRGYTQA